MKKLGSDEARRTFRDLLDAAVRGEYTEISRNGKPIAVLTPAVGRSPGDTAPHWPHVNEDDLDDLRAERGRLISCLSVIEEILREKHGYNVTTV